MEKNRDTISIANFDEHQYTLQLASFLNDIQDKCFIEYKKISERIEQNWNCEIYDLFDKATGGIFVRDYECYHITSALQEAFLEHQGTALIYSCPLDNGILLRGPLVYYYLVCFKEKYRYPTVKSVEQWWENIKVFLEQLEKAITKDCKESDNFTNKGKLIQTKFIMGCLDNLRHFVLICMNSKAVLDSYGISDIIKVKENNYLVRCSEVLSKIHALLVKTSFEKCDLIELYNQVLDIIKNVKRITHNIFNELNNIGNEEVNAKCLKLHREVDSFIENYVTLKYAAKEIEKELQDEKKPIYVYGILNGSVEISIMFVNLVTNHTLEPIYMIIPGDYLTRHGVNDCIAWNKEMDYDDSCLLIDDNTMTGTTVELAMKYINEQRNSAVKKCILIRHPDINRIAQMDAYKKAISIDFLQNHCVGLLNESPYSKIKSGTNIGGEYLDELGVFTLTGDYFLRFLYKNGIYDKGSEVDNFRTINL